MLNLVAIILGFIGALLAFLDSMRTASRFPEVGILTGYPKFYQTRFWRYCGRIGFAFMMISFILQFVSALAEYKK